MIKRNSFLLILFSAALIYCCSNLVRGPEYYQPKALATHSNGEEFVGSLTCLECHADIYADHIKTAHYNTSALASEKSLKGSFKDGSNILEVGNLEFEMVKEGNAFYQIAKLKSGDRPVSLDKIDISIGSGVKGQSYLSWEEDKLFQVQASYYPPDDIWINSPGYPPQLLKRPIDDACLKCHVTFATNRDFSGAGNQYDKGKMIYGVDCERCHRPAAKHVIYHRANPDAKASRFMLKLDTLSRQLRLDACAQCHSGLRARILKGNSFTYLTGEPLDEYARNFYTGKPTQELDVHGNQYGLLTSSACFKQTQMMDCGTCHDPHKNQRGQTAFFNKTCMDCHSGGSQTICAATETVRSSMNNNCISCHMPNAPSKTMSFQLTGDTLTPAYVRTHLIGVYDKELWLD